MISSGTLNAELQGALIKPAASLEEVVAGALYVQECVFENINLKRDVFG